MKMKQLKIRWLSLLNILHVWNKLLVYFVVSVTGGLSICALHSIIKFQVALLKFF